MAAPAQTDYMRMHKRKSNECIFRKLCFRRIGWQWIFMYWPNAALHIHGMQTHDLWVLPPFEIAKEPKNEELKVECQIRIEFNSNKTPQ